MRLAAMKKHVKERATSQPWPLLLPATLRPAAAARRPIRMARSPRLLTRRA